MVETSACSVLRLFLLPMLSLMKQPGRQFCGLSMFPFQLHFVPLQKLHRLKILSWHRNQKRSIHNTERSVCPEPPAQQGFFLGLLEGLENVCCSFFRLFL